MHVIGQDGEPTAEVRAIFDLVKQHDAVLATGHTTAVEHYAVIKAFAREGKLLVTHAGEKLAGPHLSAQQCRELADLGAMIELTALCCQTVFGIEGKSAAAMAAMIREIGPARCTLSSDYGWNTALPRPAAGLQDFLEQLWAEGITEGELTMMAATNPARLLGLWAPRQKAIAPARSSPAAPACWARAWPPLSPAKASTSYSRTLTATGWSRSPRSCARAGRRY